MTDVGDAATGVEVDQIGIMRRNKINTEGIMMRLHGDGQSLGDETLLLNSPHALLSLLATSLLRGKILC
jgi:hypothetical protein